jgi:hypothetical protein
LPNGPNLVIARERRHAMSVGAGFYLLHYASSRAPDHVPTVRVTPSPAADKNIMLLPLPGRPGDSLSAPGECILIRAEQPGSLELTVCASRPNGSLEAEVRLERIAAAETGAGHDSAAAMPLSAEAQPELDLLAHVSRRGDVPFKQGAWICGPDRPMAIEGLEIRWPGKPADVDLRYGVVIGGRDRPILEQCEVGRFAGTRGQAAPLLGVTLALCGPRARDYELRADALFHGSAAMSKSGSDIAFYGPTGREPLVGFRLSVVKTRIEPEIVQPPIKARAVAMKQVGRVRVYRPGTGPAPKNKRAVRA